MEVPKMDRVEIKITTRVPSWLDWPELKWAVRSAIGGLLPSSRPATEQEILDLAYATAQIRVEVLDRREVSDDEIVAN